MMGRLNHEQEQFFYSFRLDDAVQTRPPKQMSSQIIQLAYSAQAARSKSIIKSRVIGTASRLVDSSI